MLIEHIQRLEHPEEGFLIRLLARREAGSVNAIVDRVVNAGVPIVDLPQLLRAEVAGCNEVAEIEDDIVNALTRLIDIPIRTKRSGS